MPNSTNTPRFIPLNASSQSGADNVLYYDNQASLDTISEALTGRLMAVYHLLESLHEFANPPAYALSAVSIVSTLLLSDVVSLLEEFNPIALTLRAEQETNDTINKPTNNA